MRDDAFLQAIRDDPQADAPRLIYADWLEEQGDAMSVAKAEFLRATTGNTASTGRKGRKVRREYLRELAAAVDPEWLAQVSGLAAIYEAGLCPVCGWAQDEKPWDKGCGSFAICEGCGIQFGYTDAAGGDRWQRIKLYRMRRSAWINGGKLWWGINPCPGEWDPDKQLERLAQLRSD